MELGWDQAYYEAIAHVSTNRSVSIKDSRGYPGFPPEDHDLVVRMTSTGLALALSFQALLGEDLAVQHQGRRSMRLMYALVGLKQDEITEALRATMQSKTRAGSLWVKYVETFPQFKDALIEALDTVVSIRNMHASPTAAVGNELALTINENLPISATEADNGVPSPIGFGSGGL